MSLALTNNAVVLPTLAADTNMDTLPILALVAAASASAACAATGAAADGEQLAGSADVLHGARGEANLQVCVAQGIDISCRSETTNIDFWES